MKQKPEPITPPRLYKIAHDGGFLQRIAEKVLGPADGHRGSSHDIRGFSRYLPSAA
jgi:hypothetical protein